MRTNKLFLSVMQQQSVSKHTAGMTKHIANLAVSMGATVRHDAGNLYVTKGISAHYPCMVAHTDTVHDIIPDEDYEILESEGGVYLAFDRGTLQQVGIGGDDKVGIYLALSMLRHLDAVKLAFFRDEEIGCLGASEADLTFFADCAFVLEADRRGIGEWVDRIGTVALSSPAFNAAVTPILTAYATKTVNGMLTDVLTLKRNGLAVCAANIACGYYYPHTDKEVVSLPQVMETEDLILTVIAELGGQQWPHEGPPEPTWKRRDDDAWWGRNGTMTGGVQHLPLPAHTSSVPARHSGIAPRICALCDGHRRVRWHAGWKLLVCRSCRRQLERIDLDGVKAPSDTRQAWGTFLD